MTTGPTHKPWGWSTRVYCNEQVQVERIFIQPGGFSSIHTHVCKANQFVVSRGTLLVNEFDDQMQPTVSHMVEAGEDLTIEPSIRHQFVACSLVEGYEFYWPRDDTDLDPNDIVRFSTNGVDEAWMAKRAAAAYPYCCVCNQPHEAKEMVAVFVENALRDMCRDCVAQTSTTPYFKVEDR